MKYMTLILISYMLMSCVFGQGRTVTINSRAIILENTDSVDLSASGKWFVQFNQDDWIKINKTLYPDKSDRTRAVSDAQAAFKDELDKYVIAAMNADKFASLSKGTGLTLSARTAISYFAVEFEDGVSCQIYIRQNNKQYILSLYDNLADESAAATTARGNMVDELSIISTAANSGNFYE